MVESIRTIFYPDPMKNCEWLVLCCFEQDKTCTGGEKRRFESNFAVPVERAPATPGTPSLFFFFLR